MKIRALCSFSGRITMAEGDARECNNEYVVNDLLRAGYVEMVEIPSPAKNQEEKPKKATRKKKAVTDGENQ